MARSRRPWSTLRTEMRRYLGDTDAPYTYSDELLLDAFNFALDDRALDLGLEQQFYTTRRFLSDLVAGQAFYDLPEAIGRVVRVLRRFDDGREFELVRFQGEEEPTATSAIGPYSLPTYRFLGANIRLSPPPSAAQTDGLVIEAEIAEDHFTGDANLLPLSWPIWMEELLKLDAMLIVLEQEQEEGGELQADGESSTLRLRERRSKYARKLEDYLQRRTLSPGAVKRYQQGA